MSESNTPEGRSERYQELLAHYELAAARMKDLAGDPFSSEDEFQSAHEEFASLTAHLLACRMQMAESRPDA